jgi:phosphoglycerate dehydrogenase-like enzyme
MRDANSLCAQLLSAAGFDVVFPPEGQWMPVGDELVDWLDGVDAVVASSEKYTPAIIQRSQLRVISRAGVGYDAVDVPAATEHGVVVTITSGAVTQSVVEHTLALVIAVFRGTISRDAEVRRGEWSRKPLPRLAGKTAGIVGLGVIGKAVAKAFQAIGLHVVACDPVWDAEFAEAHQVRRLEFSELLSEVDIVSLHAPATDQTVGMMDAAALERVRPGCVLINTSRGSLVDEAAVAAALSSGRLAGAGLDVFAKEPAPLDSPLLSAPHTVLATHMGGLDESSAETMARVSAQNVIDLAAGRWPVENILNRQLGPDWSW